MPCTHQKFNIFYLSLFQYYDNLVSFHIITYNLLQSVCKNSVELILVFLHIYGKSKTIFHFYSEKWSLNPKYKFTSQKNLSHLVKLEVVYSMSNFIHKIAFHHFHLNSVVGKKSRRGPSLEGGVHRRPWGGYCTQFYQSGHRN